jgi:hypothetical protein
MQHQRRERPDSIEGQRPRGCLHEGPLVVDSLEGDAPRRARCLVCGAVGPERATSVEAAHALRLLDRFPRHRADERPLARRG